MGSLKPAFDLLLSSLALSPVLQPVVKSFAVDFMSDLRKTISDQLNKLANSGTDSRGLLELAVDLQPFRRQLNMPVFKKPLQINNLVVPSLASEDQEGISMTAFSSSNYPKKPMWHGSRTVSASSIKHRLAALSNPQSNFNSRIDAGMISAGRG